MNHVTKYGHNVLELYFANAKVINRDIINNILDSGFHHPLTEEMIIANQHFDRILLLKFLENSSNVLSHLGRIPIGQFKEIIKYS